ncbi:NAD(P)H-dependent oxidoreductase [Seohaeicola sp. SP36]|uniref:NAD(P)H-dependent oxidoreductase n=1 Tax=unclassified Seohaeicola TaxID=2641111 RepID=UPI00237BE287|nr:MULTISPECIES: NAD(P)H-dependent oxidoreductase [unclassified Seohaeicola]MDD9709752.1 NAD(P)H-dependent oxidoreductase [Seohaeicola sp. 4SK31]MDD9737979.1 NAD(P)H-dependent oxidoreductase [Seohaeicola sp. SP36]
MATSRNVLIVVAHPERSSFNHAMAQAAASALREAGHNVTVSDLYAEGFRADVGRHDMSSVADPERFHVQAEQSEAVRNIAFAPDIAREQARLAAADNLILQFPLWWGGPPGMLKGWIDRVLAYGFAYVDGRRFETGLFKGRRAMLSVTTGGTPSRFAEDGVYGPIGPILMPVQRLALEYMGYEVAPAYVAHGVPRSDDAERQGHLDAFSKAAQELADLPTTPTDDYLHALEDVAEGAWKRPG